MKQIEDYRLLFLFQPPKPDQPVPQTWNIEVFLDVLKENVPTLNWVQVIQELDHPGFLIKDPKGLHLIRF